MGFFNKLIGKEAHIGTYHAVCKLLIQHACDTETTCDFFELLSLPYDYFEKIYIHKKYLSFSTILIAFKMELSKDKLAKMLPTFQMELDKYYSSQNLPTKSKELHDKALKAVTNVYFQIVDEMVNTDTIISLSKLADQMSFTYTKFCELEGDPLSFQFGKEIFHYHFSFTQKLIDKHINK